MRNATSILCKAALLLIPAAVSANMDYSGNASYTYNDNISNAINDRDIFSDHAVEINFNGGKLWLPAVGKSIYLQGNLGAVKHSDAEGLDEYSYGANLSYIQRLGLGAYAPRIGLSLSASKRDFETDMRDGWLYRASVTLEKRFTPALHASATLTREKRTADADKTQSYYAQIPSDVFNQDNNELSAAIDYTLENNSVLTARYLFRDGEISASTNPASNFFFYTSAVAQDYEICDACEDYVAYLVDARIHSLLLDWNWALGNDTSVSTGYERRIARTRGDNTYTSHIFRIQLNRRF